MKKCRAMKVLAVLAAVMIYAAADAHDMADMDSSATEADPGAMGTMGHLKMGEHMTMTESRPVTPADLQRANQILATMREKLAKYQDYKVAEADGYEPYMPTVPQDLYHFANRQATMSEYMGDFDLARPGSLLYEKQALGGYKLVGAMYDAPQDAAPDQLDKLIPLSIAHWHAHTNICLPKGLTRQDVMNGNVGARMRPDISSVSSAPEQRGYGEGAATRMRFGYVADPRFGFEGTISTAADCEAVEGNFNKQIFGWMIHVYPFNGDDLKVAFGMSAP